MLISLSQFPFFNFYEVDLYYFLFHASSCLNYTLELPSSCYDVEKDTLAFTKVDAFLPGKIYYQGCLKAFLQITKWNGPEVLLHGQLLLNTVILLNICWLRIWNCRQRHLKLVIYLHLISRWSTLGTTYLVTLEGLQKLGGVRLLLFMNWRYTVNLSFSIISPCTYWSITIFSGQRRKILDGFKRQLWQSKRMGVAWLRQFINF